VSVCVNVCEYVCVSVCSVSVAWKRSGINRFKWRTCSAKVAQSIGNGSADKGVRFLRNIGSSYRTSILIIPTLQTPNLMNL